MGRRQQTCVELFVYSAWDLSARSRPAQRGEDREPVSRGEESRVRSGVRGPGSWLGIPMPGQGRAGVSRRRRP